MKRMFAGLTASLLLAGIVFCETGTNSISDEKSLENVVNSAKSNAQAYKKDTSGKTNQTVSDNLPVTNAVEKKEGTNAEKQSYMIIPFSLSIFPVWINGYKTIVYAQVNIGVGYCDVLQGLSLGFVNIAGEKAKGADCSLVGITGGDFNGVQCSLVTFTANDFKGTQLALVNYVNGNFSFVQAGLVNIVGGNFNGAQAGLVNIIGGEYDGAMAGLVNLTGGNFTGVECGLVNLSVKTNDGAQAGLVNIANRFQGVQVGLVNYAGDLDGVSVGLVSIVARNGQTHAQVTLDETGFANVALIHGSKTIYNIYQVGMDLTANYWSYGLGLGCHLPLDPFYLNIEIMSSSISHIEKWDGMNTLSKGRVYAGFSIFDHLSVIAGISLNVYKNWEGSSVTVSPVYNFSKTFDNGMKIWPGLFAGIAF